MRNYKLPTCPKCGRESVLQKSVTEHEDHYDVERVFICPEHGLLFIEHAYPPKEWPPKKTAKSAVIGRN